MKTLRKVIAGVLCLATVLTMTACGNSDSNNSTGGDNSAQTDVQPSGGSMSDDPTVLNYLGTYDPTKAGDIKPAYKKFKEDYSATIEVEIIPDADIMDKLATYISSGTSPDLVDKRDNTFPYFITKNMYTPLDGYIDFASEQWSGVSSYIENYVVNGKHYYVPWTYVISPMLIIYNRGKFEELGIQDPKTLYDAGNWTWDTFYDCMEKFVEKQKSDIPDVLGFYGVIGSSFINSTGSTLIALDNGKLVNNIRSTQVETAQAFMEKLKKEKLSNLTYADYTNVAIEPIVYGQAAFQSVGDWNITNYCQLQQDDENLDIFFVPTPRYPNADKTYYTLSTFGYMVPSGSEKAELAAKFINCVRLSVQDPELMQATKESTIKQKKYTDEQYDFWYYFHDISNFTPDQLIMDYSYALDKTTNNDVMIPMLEDIPFNNGEDVMSWTNMRETYYNIVDDKINELNKLIG